MRRLTPAPCILQPLLGCFPGPSTAPPVLREMRDSGKQSVQAARASVLRPRAPPPPLMDCSAPHGPRTRSRGLGRPATCSLCTPAGRDLSLPATARPSPASVLCVLWTLHLPRPPPSAAPPGQPPSWRSLLPSGQTLGFLFFCKGHRLASPPPPQSACPQHAPGAGAAVPTTPSCTCSTRSRHSKSSVKVLQIPQALGCRENVSCAQERDEDRGPVSERPIPGQVAV